MQMYSDFEYHICYYFFWRVSVEDQFNKGAKTISINRKKKNGLDRPTNL